VIVTAGPLQQFVSHVEPVGVLGGMGPAAGADFMRLFVQACMDLMAERGIAVRDQNFPEHWLAQVPVPDRSAHLMDNAAPGALPLAHMLQAVGRLTALGVRAIAIACNTAHAWHAPLQERFPQVEMLHIADETAIALQQAGITRVGLLATEGTYASGIYGKALQTAGLVCHLPQADERQVLMAGIYQGVKAGRMRWAGEQFAQVALELARRHELQALILGCTEIPLALRALPAASQVRLVDPSRELARALARRAYLHAQIHTTTPPETA
jgi:aspartate racemase